MGLGKSKLLYLANSRFLEFLQVFEELCSHTFLHFIRQFYCLFFSIFHNFRLYSILTSRKNIKISARRKGAIHVDYILAVSIFLIFFALTIQYVTDYFSTVKETTTIADLRSESLSLLGAADRSFDPSTWPQIVNGSNDLVLLMHLNNDTLDYSGKGNNATINNGVNCSASVVGRFFGGCSFDGADDFINLTSFHSNLTAFTIEAWINAKNVTNTNQQAIVSKDRSDSRSFMLSIANTANCTNKTKVERAGSDIICGNTIISPNVWYHIAVTSNGTNYTLYVSGSSDNSNTSTELPNLADAWLIGQRNLADADAEQFNGTIDEVAIYNSSLSASEIREHYQQGLNRIGLRTETFRFIVFVNNTKPNLVNTSENASAQTLVNELVRLNLSTFGFGGIDYNSVVIYNETSNQVPFQINGSNITFSANVTVNASRQFTVYFDDDSLFGEKSQAVITQNDNLTETFLPAERISLLQYEKLVQLNQSNYTNVRNTADMESNFRIKLIDADTNATFIDYGGTIPRKGNIIALQRYAVFQNSTAGIRNGRLTIQTW